MGAYIINPSPGESNVDPKSEIIIVFDSGGKDTVCITIDGERAVTDGKTHKGFSTTFCKEFDGKVIWGVRKIGRLQKRDILVQAYNSSFCYTVNQRFYVKGAKVKKEFDPRGKNWAHTKYGIHKSDKTPTRWGVDVEDFNIPAEVKKGAKHIELGSQDNEWRAVVCHDDRTVLVGEEFSHTFYIISEDAVISKDIINLKLKGGPTAHMPFLYVPASTNDDCLHMVDHKKENVEFGDGLHVWWDKDEFITKRDMRPITRESDDMLWTSKDIGTKIRDLKIITEDIILINNRVIVDTLMPKVSYL